MRCLLSASGYCRKPRWNTWQPYICKYCMPPACLACLLCGEAGVTLPAVHAHLSSCTTSICCNALGHFLTSQNESTCCSQMKAHLHICLCLYNCLWIKIMETTGFSDPACTEARRHRELERGKMGR